MQKVLEPEPEVLEQCREGNRTAFREIFYMYRSYAFNLIYKITGPYADHEEILQEAFFQVYLSLKSFKGNSTFKTWFHRIVIHACTRKWRYENTEKRISSKDTVSYDQVEHMMPHHAPGQARRLELKDLVERAMATLDMKLRIPLVLSVYGELDLAEIGRMMGIPEGTVKSRLFTARKKIRDYLDGIEE
jgi:RNA polymerase sigma-70 factor (ECF subfamily)